MADPDNYTDPPTFLSHLQRNPRLQPYEFWPLVADSTVIVQHLSSVAIFVACFTSIYQEKVSPVSIVSLGSTCTIIGWFLWDFWVGQEEAARTALRFTSLPDQASNGSTKEPRRYASTDFDHSRPSSSNGSELSGLGLTMGTGNLEVPGNQRYAEDLLPTPSHSSLLTPTSSASTGINSTASPRIESEKWPPNSTFSAHNEQRLTTIRSTIVITAVVAGVSPILKSLTVSTSKDSIWAISALLLCLNIIFFDYSGGVGVKSVFSFVDERLAANVMDRLPASLSTNAAVFASIVLASRLSDTTHVYYLTLFSIQVFGLFPVFRRHLRHISWRGHLFLTLVLVLGAGGGLGLVLSSSGSWPGVVVGMLLWSLVSAFGMGGCSWWLIGLQRYKNVVTGPWDPARPVIRGGGWE
ncbi:MAG: hypothetical protein Q9174_002854 [Haloplaca sp. 1 TL-2023]